MTPAEAHKRWRQLFRKEQRLKKLARSLRFHARWVPEEAFLMQRTAKQLEATMEKLRKEREAVWRARDAGGVQ